MIDGLLSDARRPRRVVAFVEKEHRRFAGIRMAGNSFWQEPKHWALISEHEGKLQGAVCNSRIAVLCSHSVDRHTACDVLEVPVHHDFALARHESGWQRIESSGVFASTKADRVVRIQECDHFLAARRFNKVPDTFFVL